MSDQVQAPKTPATKNAPKTLFEEYLTPKFFKDVRFALYSFVVMVIIIFHYAWIMRQLVLNPYLPRLRSLFYFTLFGIDVVIVGYVLLFVLYPQVYAEEIALEKAALEKKEQ
ncbi:uncharacterized protein RJT20DRAFT_3192 [Scheffersomyces xylosifermentans]|uniref:uncharacterized protein n=1 Tax=Scheffersomyces xylosifermentans TaxID=1304137 RepID=UPI00315D1FA6